MKNYTFTHVIKERGGIELDWHDWTENQIRHSTYIEKFLAPAVINSDTGWDNLVYKVIKYPNGSISTYMVLCVDGIPERWIPIEGNSKGCNLQILGENIF